MFSFKHGSSNIHDQGYPSRASESSVWDAENKKLNRAKCGSTDL